MEFVSGNIFIREMRFDRKGQVVDSHEHNFDHTTYVVRGALRIESPDKVVEKRASDGQNWVLIKAGVKHKITALEDGSVGHCIYAHRTAQSEIVQEYTGWGPAYL